MIKKSSAAKFVLNNTIPIQITADEPDFLPQYKSDATAADVFALIPALNHKFIQALNLNHRVLHVVDCGIKVKLDEKYRLRGEIISGWAKRGLYLLEVFLEDERLKLRVVNFGQEAPLVIPHKTNIAKIWAEPVYLFDWK